MLNARGELSLAKFDELLRHQLKIFIQRHLTDVMSISMKTNNIENLVMISAIRFMILQNKEEDEMERTNSRMRTLSKRLDAVMVRSQTLHSKSYSPCTPCTLHLAKPNPPSIPFPRKPGLPSPQSKYTKSNPRTCVAAAGSHPARPHSPHCSHHLPKNTPSPAVTRKPVRLGRAFGQGYRGRRGCGCCCCRLIWGPEC
jgi:hypothetical protein